jgi:hypothetical protein
MFSAKRVIFIFIQIHFWVCCFGQKGKTDSLEKQLPELKDSARIDCLNALGKVFSEFQNDSALFYCKEANREAIRLNYYRGIAESSYCLGLVKWKRQADFDAMEIFFGSLFVLLLLGIVIFRNITLKRKSERLQNERTQIELRQQTTELGMQALRAQMNPHFIFNSLNSINRFILQNNRTQASEYLTKFSRMVRMILQNSQASQVTLENEIESLTLYLDLESLRFNHHFSYKISVPDELDVSMIKIPPLIIQPYVENAIWHGLMHKEERGQLDIEIYEENQLLFIKIADDGIGRKKAVEFMSKSATRHKSLGLRITADRIAMLRGIQGTQATVTINDLVSEEGEAAGTEVIIKIPFIYV